MPFVVIAHKLTISRDEAVERIIELANDMFCGRHPENAEAIMYLAGDIRITDDSCKASAPVEIERLRDALKPFAEAWTSPEPRHPLDEDYHEAARALGMAE